MRAVLAGAGLIAAAAAHAQPAATVRVGSHPGFGRVVFDMPAPTGFQLSEHGSRVVVTFSGGGTIGMTDVAALPQVTERLLAAGYTEADLRKIWSGNLLRLLGQAEAARER